MDQKTTAELEKLDKKLRIIEETMRMWRKEWRGDADYMVKLRMMRAKRDKLRDKKAIIVLAAAGREQLTDWRGSKYHK